jgi:hypothetical protein
MSISTEIVRHGVNTLHTKASRRFVTARRGRQSIDVIEV